MTTLTVLKFGTPTGAEQVLGVISDLQKQHLITLHDAAIVSWPEGKKKPKTRQLTNMAAAGALSGAFWGMLFGLIFLIPLFGLAIGAAMGAITGSFADVGIDDNFIKSVRDQVHEGDSALFLMTSGAVVDRVADALKNYKFEVIATNLSKEQEDKLREVFSEEA
ncbi:MAG: DUF1269 domain-containing protein [Anaerolineae bacterium]|nr:DUF1269 domain-containing protein [Anaerolineae bacterium]MCB0178764.1 DUF1269 domain-containing protein [Anaerolineae bacterium]MCB0223678.1 DUF1269 domain-containing protein [Anaerolineae bacterium]MCB9106310.1 DUF1269 domain-containing protein [Anaerolineales bacterium]